MYIIPGLELVQGQVPKKQISAPGYGAQGRGYPHYLHVLYSVDAGLSETAHFVGFLNHAAHPCSADRLTWGTHYYGTLVAPCCHVLSISLGFHVSLSCFDRYASRILERHYQPTWKRHRTHGPEVVMYITCIPQKTTFPTPSPKGHLVHKRVFLYRFRPQAHVAYRE